MADEKSIEHTNWKNKSVQLLQDYLPLGKPTSILMTSGASCPDPVVEAVIRKIAIFYGVETALDAIIATWESAH